MPEITTAAVGVVDLIQVLRSVVEVLNSPKGCRAGAWRVAFRPSCRSLGALRAQLRQVSLSGEVVGGHLQREKLLDLIQSWHYHLAKRPSQLAPAKALLDAFSLALADLVTRAPGRAPVDSTAAELVEVLRRMRRDNDMAASLDEALSDVRLVRAHRHSLTGCCSVDQNVRSNAALGRAVRDVCLRDARMVALAAGYGVHDGGLCIQLRHRVVERGTPSAQGMVGLDKVLQPHQCEQSFVVTCRLLASATHFLANNVAKFANCGRRCRPPVQQADREHMSSNERDLPLSGNTISSGV